MVFRSEIRQPESWSVRSPHYLYTKSIETLVGAFGAPPTPVQGAANVLSDLVEENPDKFFRIEWYPMLDSVRSRLAKFLGARKEEIVLVQNATIAAAVVLRNFEWREGDVLVKGTLHVTLLPQVVRRSRTDRSFHNLPKRIQRNRTHS